MGGKVQYNYETFPPGTRVRVCAFNPREGSDHEWHGHYGFIVENRHWVLVRMEKGRRDWPGREIYICNHNLRKVPLTSGQRS